MKSNEFLNLVAEILEVEPGTVSMSDNLEDIDWDSLSNISFIAEVDSATGTSIDADDLANATIVSDLYVLVQGVAGSK